HQLTDINTANNTAVDSEELEIMGGSATRASAGTHESSAGSYRTSPNKLGQAGLGAE
ncbi:hypothetical protein LTS18_014427, partial [Coniosporium uncinatum]